jgi:hypothetical protein
MNLVLDVRQPRRRRRSFDGLAPPVSVLRWRSGPSTDAVYQLFSAHEAGRFGTLEPQSPDSTDGENVLLISSSRRTAPGAPAVLLSLVNTSPSQAVSLSVKLAGRIPTSVTGTILTAPPTTPRKTRTRKGSDSANPSGSSAFRGSVLKGRVVEVTVPAASVVVLTVQ